MSTKTAPETLLEAVQFFADEDVALQFVANLRWPTGEQTCPRCGVEDTHYFLASRRVWKCKGCKRQFSVKVGTIFEDSPISLSKWLPAMWMLANCRNGISSYELARALGVTQKTAWFMLHRIRLAMQTESFGKIGGEVEVDETYIGGKSRNMHKDRRERMIQGTGWAGKVAVMGLLERHGEPHSRVRTKIIANTRTATVDGVVREHVEPGSKVFTDALASYRLLSSQYVHQFVDHAKKYAEGIVHTNGLENFWSLFKRSIKGTYVAIEPFHVFRYLDEQCFRFNNRKLSDRLRFTETLRSVLDKRLTYNDLTGRRLGIA